MKLDIIISADDIKKEKILDRNAVVIDVLRATSVIITAIRNGAARVMPVVTVEDALELSRQDMENSVLGGERKAIKIEGFDCSNSPLEFTRDVVSGKNVIMTTTNGTKAINGCIEARRIFIGAIINADAVAKKISEEGVDTVFVNAGTYGQFSIDDFICSGYMISCVLKRRKDIVLTDIAKTALYIYENNKDIEGFIKYASHYQRIRELNLFDDLKYCIKKDIIDIVPEFKNGVIK